MKITEALEDCKRICAKKIGELPVAKDVVRLAHKINVNEKIGEEIKLKTNYGEKPEQVQVIYNLIEKSGEELQPKVKISKEEFNKTVNLIEPETLTKFMVENFEENGPLTTIFKSIQQTLIARVLHRLRDTMNTEGLHFRGFFNIIK
jgi:hypothetical protein